MSPISRSFVTVCESLVRSVSGAVAALGLLVLAGWAFDVPLLRSIAPAWPAMKPNTAVALLLAAGALWSLGARVGSDAARQRPWVLIAAGGVALMGTLTLAQYVFSLNIGIDGLLFPEVRDAAMPWPRRMSPVAAANFVVLGVALFVLACSSRPRAIWTAQLLAILAALGSFLALTGYLIGFSALDLHPWFTSTAVHTAAALLALCVGVLCLRPKQGLMALFSSSSAGGAMLRRLLLPLILLPVLLNWMALRGEQRGLFPADFGWILDSTVTVLLVGLLVWTVARVVHVKDLARKAAEDELLRSEERYRNLVEMSPLAIIVKDQRRIEFANPAALALVGAAETSELLGESPFAFVHPDSRATFEKGVCEVLRDGTSLVRMEQRLLRLDGSEVDVELSATPVDYHGRRHAQVVARDITENKRMRETVRASLERMQLLARATGDALWDWDVVHDTTWWSDTFFEKFGYASGTIPTYEAWLDHVHPDDRERAAAEFDEALARKATAWSSEYRFRLADGSYGVVFDRVFGVFDASGNLVRMVGSMIDITELRHVEDQARLLSHAVESTSDLISITTLDDRFLFANQAFLDAYGYTLVEILGRTPAMLGAAQRGPAAMLADVRSGALEGGWNGELVNRRKDGTEFPIHLNASAVRDAHGRAVALMGVARDITKQKRLDAELARHRDNLMELVEERTRELVEARELAETANRAKSAFLATMSHEIRTPLNGVIAMAEMLTLRPLAPQDLDSAETIQRSAHNLMEVINDILDFSKIEAGKLELEVADLSLRQVADDVSASLHSVAASNDVDLSVDVAPDLPAFVRGDATRVRQVLLNLAGNAIKFSGGRADIRGQVSVRLERASERPLRVVLRIADNGIGMSPATLSRLFTSFTQAETSTTRRFGGTGLGLAISRRLVELMEGTIDVRSEEGRGSVFTVTLPFQVSERQHEPVPGTQGARPPRADEDQAVRVLREDAPAPSVEEARAQGRLILVAEDDSMNRKVIARQLALLGFAAEIAHDGVEALQLWRQGAYALLLSDLHMPNMDGYELVAAIRREEPPGVRLPIVALTANALRGEAERTAAAGMDGYLTKPVPLATLRAVLDRYLPPAAEPGGDG